MEQSATIGELAKALKAFQKDAPAVTKDGKANYGKYATLGNTIDTTREELAKNGLSYSQFPDGAGLTTILMHDSGEWLKATGELKLDKATAQGQGSGITYLRRYALAAVLGIATEDDDDGAAAEPKKPVAAAKPAAKPLPPSNIDAALTAKKKRIKDLCDANAAKTNTKITDYPTFVEATTGLKLLAEYYDQIIERLEALQ